jgi:hypothetical protein
MIKVTADELKQIAYSKRITSWTADRCADCDYPIKFIFGETVTHDPGCHCSDKETHRPIRFQASSWQLVADWINMQTDGDKIKEIKQFWSL